MNCCNHYVILRKTIYSCKHDHGSENWIVVKGQALITLNGIGLNYGIKNNIDIPVDVEHQISDITNDPIFLLKQLLERYFMVKTLCQIMLRM